MKERVLNDLPSGKKRVVIDGKKVQALEDFLIIMENEFDFPRPCKGSIDRCLDWMTDLTWYDFKKFELVITNRKEFVKDDIALRNDILSWFTRIILPFWEEEVLEVTVGGELKEFDVYLVDNVIDKTTDQHAD